MIKCHFVVIFSLLSVHSVFPQKAAIFNSDEWVSISNSDTTSILPNPITYADQENNAEIFIGISEYRDNRCPTTLNNIFSKAKYPQRIRVGLVQQIHTEEDHIDCITSYCGIAKGGCIYKSQIDTVTFSFQDSRGPNFARSFENNLLKTEEFCLQIDSHTDFVQGTKNSVIVHNILFCYYSI